MSNDYDLFIGSIDSYNTAKVAKSLKIIGEYDYSNITPVEIDGIVLSAKPNSQKSITTILYIMSLYMKHIGNDDGYRMVRNADRKAIWLKAKPTAKKKFISHSHFIEVCDDIMKNEEHNALYQQTLFRCLYEGIYSDDMSALKNIKASDVQGNMVTVNTDDGDSHRIEASCELAEDLKKLGDVSHWWRNNRYGAYKIDIDGVSKDSCFKVENRSGSDEYAYRYSYYRILRKISKEYVGHNLLPLQLYISGIMRRISISFDENGIDLKEAFSDNNKDRLVNAIISNELERSNCKMEVRNFRELVKGHIDVFDDGR